MRNRINVSWLRAACAAGCVAALATACDSRRDESAETAGRPARAGKSAAAEDRESLPYLIAHQFDHLPPAERRQAEAIQKACDDENLEALRKVVSEVVSSTNAELRLSAVEALGWFDHRVAEDFEVWFGDADENVAETAAGGWDSAITQIESPRRKITLTAKVLAMDVRPELRESASIQFAGAANELIDGAESDQEGRMARRRVMSIVIGLIESPKAEIAKTGRELYEEITGGAWKDRAAAEKYVADADRYMDDAAEEFAEGVRNQSK